jgi:hypothetical protein
VSRRQHEIADGCWSSSLHPTSSQIPGVAHSGSVDRIRVDHLDKASEKIRPQIRRNLVTTFTSSK